MKKYIMLFLVLTSVSSAQFPMVAAWQSAAVAFSPADIDGLRLWLEADDIGVTKSTGDSTYIWMDKSGNGNHMYQIVSAQKPRWYDSTIGTASGVVVFDGVDDAMSLVGVCGIDSARGRTHVIVYRAHKPLTRTFALWQGQSGSVSNYIAIDNANPARAGTAYDTARGSYFMDAQYAAAYPEPRQSLAFTGQINIYDSVAVNTAASTLQVFADGDSLALANAVTLTAAKGPGSGLWNTTQISGLVPAKISVVAAFIYNWPLSYYERLRLEAYIRAKWGTP